MNDTTARSRQLSLFVFIDAFGWALSQRHPFLNHRLTTKAPLQTIFGYSSTCDPTILTGKLPREHGHFTFFYYNPAQSPFRRYRLLGALPRTVMNRARVRNKLSQIAKRLHGYTGYFQLYNMPFQYLHLFDYAEKRDIYEAGGINSGASTIFDFLREQRIPFSVSDWRADERARLDALKSAVEQGAAGFAFLFLGCLDAVLHNHGTLAPQVARHLQWYEQELEAVIARAERRYESVRLFVFSDHGMTDITGTCDVMRRIGALKLRFGVDYAAVYDSTIARFWFLNERARDLIADALKQEPLGRIVPDEDLRRWGCDFPNRQYGELFFLMNPGILICPSFMGERPLPAMHGYDPGDADSVASFMTNAPVHPLPRRLDDLYGLMRAEAEPGRTGA